MRVNLGPSMCGGLEGHKVRGVFKAVQNESNFISVVALVVNDDSVVFKHKFTSCTWKFKEVVKAASSVMGSSLHMNIELCAAITCCGTLWYLSLRLHCWLVDVDSPCCWIMCSM